MKGLAELTAENDAIVARAEKRRADSIKRLKARIRRKVFSRGRFLVDFGLDHIYTAIDAWHAAEKRRG